MKVVDLAPGGHSIANALEIVDRLRVAVLDGRVSGFYGVSVNDNDDTEAWSFATKGISLLRMQGAVAHLEYCMHTGEA